MATYVEGIIFEALAIKLAALTLSPAVPIAWPNIDESGIPGDYLRPTHIPSPTSQITLGDDGQNRHVGTFQVDVFWRVGQGLSAPLARAGAIAAHFRRGTVLVNGSIAVRVIRPPSVGPALQEPTHLMVPVSIRYQADAANPS